MRQSALQDRIIPSDLCRTRKRSSATGLAVSPLPEGLHVWQAGELDGSDSAMRQRPSLQRWNVPQEVRWTREPKGNNTVALRCMPSNTFTSQSNIYSGILCYAVFSTEFGTAVQAVYSISLLPEHKPASLSTTRAAATSRTGTNRQPHHARPQCVLYGIRRRRKVNGPQKLCQPTEAARQEDRYRCAVWHRCPQRWRYDDVQLRRLDSRFVQGAFGELDRSCKW